MHDSPGNFSTHFLDACSDKKNPHAKQIDVLRVADLPALNQIAKWVAFGQKFYLPYGSYIERGEGIQSVMQESDAGLLKLPFPVTVLEYRMGMQSHSVSATHSPLWRASGDKRITLLVDIPPQGEVDVANVRRSCFAEAIDPDLWTMLDTFGGVMAFALWFDEMEQAWSIGVGALVVPRNAAMENVSLAQIQELQRNMNHPGLSHSADVRIVHALVPSLMGTYARMAHQHGHARVQESMRDDVLSGACVGMDFLRTFHCANVRTEPVAMGGLEQRNKHRRKAGKVPFFAYRVLVVESPCASALTVFEWLHPGRLEKRNDGSRLFVSLQHDNPQVASFCECIAS